MTKVKDIKLTQSWQYLAYIYLALPGLLFCLAFLLKNTGFGATLAILFHNYGLFVMNPIPNFSTFVGVIGAGLALFFAGWAVFRRDWLDLVLSLALAGGAFAYFYFEWNYILAGLLRFGNMPSVAF